MSAFHTVLKMSRLHSTVDEFSPFSGLDVERLQKPSVRVTLAWFSIASLVTLFWGSVATAAFLH
jgi:hypothetical protein